MTNKIYPHIITSDGSITIYGAGKVHSVPSDFKHIEDIKKLIKAGEFDKAIEKMSVSAKINKFGNGKITVEGGVVLYNGQELHNVITDRIIVMIAEGYNAQPIINFLEKLLQNPSNTAVQELYLFLESGKLPITEDGHFLAYKKVRSDYKDYYTQTYDHTPGSVLSMERFKVDDNRHNTCSSGFHFCSLSYLPHYYGNEGKVMIVKINPKDVVSIPSDYNNAKGRACSYTVLEEYTGPETEHAFNSSVWLDPSNDFDPDSEHEEEAEEDFSDFSDFIDRAELDERPENDNSSVDGGTFVNSSYTGSIPEKIKKILGTFRKSSMGTFMIIGTSGPIRNDKGHFTGDWTLVVRDVISGVVSDFRYNDVMINSVDVPKPSMVEHQARGVDPSIVAKNSLNATIEQLTKEREKNKGKDDEEGC